MLKKTNRTILLAIILFLIGLKGMAQQTVTLSGLIDRVLTENYQIKIVSNEAKQAKNNNTPGNAGFLPTLDIQGTNSKAINNTHQELFNGTVRDGNNAQSKTYSAYVEANWTIFDGFRMFAQHDKLVLLEQIGQMQARYLIEQTIADVSEAYYQLIMEMSLYNNLQKTLEVSRFRYKLELKRKQVGSGTSLDYNLALMDYNTDSLSVVQQKQTIKSLEIQLNRLSKLDPDQPVIPTEQTMETTIIPDKSTLTDLAVDANKDIKLAMAQELIAEKNVKIQQAARYPQIDLNGRYAYSKQTNEVGVTQLNKTYGSTFGITVRLNLYNGGNLNKAIDNERLAGENSTLTRKNTLDLITSQVVEDYYEYQSLHTQKAIAQSNIELAEKSQEIARAQLERGAINGYDFRQTQLAVITAKNRLLQIEFALKSLEVELDRLTGKLEKNIQTN